MKKLQTTATVAAMMLGFGLSAQAADTSEEMRDVGAFKEIKLMGSMDVEVTVGGEQSVKVIADSDIIEHVETTVSGDTLRVKLENGRYGNIKVMRVVVTMPEMTGASIQGSGDMVVTGADAADFELELQGSGDIELDGTCDDIKIDLQGSGDVDAGDLKCKVGEIDLRGSGDIEFYASDSANVGVHGSGDVVVLGSPDKVNSRVRGSGDIIMR